MRPPVAWCSYDGRLAVTTQTQLKFCEHCGSVTESQQCAEYTYTEYVYPDRGAGVPIYNVTWRLFQCLECSCPTLEQYHDEQVRDEPLNEVLYPQPKQPLANLPPSVKRAYEAALKVRMEPNAYAVQLGRTLEVLCKHEQAEGQSLAQKLQALADSNRIPQTLARMAEQVRLIRNLGAHADEDEVTKKDTLVIEKFVETILEYLYVAPAMLAAVQTRLKKG
jgi:hypothetical protein